MKYDFIEIGTSDFGTLIQSSTNEIGISIEPLKIYLDRLPDKDNVIKLNSAITEVDGFFNIHWIDPEDIKKYDLPDWLRGCNSIIKPHPSALEELKKRNLLEIYRNSICKGISWSSLIEIYDIKKVQFLKLDCEGYDCNIVNNIIQTNKVLPEKIFFEVNILTDEKLIKKTISNLITNNYKILNRTENDLLVEKK